MADEADLQRPNRIRYLRRRSRLTQAELAKLMDVDPTTVARHESRARQIMEPEILKYAQAFKCDTHEIFFEPALDDDAGYVPAVVKVERIFVPQADASWSEGNGA